MIITKLFFLSSLISSRPKIFDEKSFRILGKESMQKFLDRNTYDLNLTSIPISSLILERCDQEKWEKILLDDRIEKSRHVDKLYDVLFFKGKHNNLDVMLMFGLYGNHFETLLGYNYVVDYPLSRIKHAE